MTALYVKDSLSISYGGNTLLRKAERRAKVDQSARNQVGNVYHTLEIIHCAIREQDKVERVDFANTIRLDLPLQLGRIGTADVEAKDSIARRNERRR